ncbi:aldo-keto reductase family 4 member C10-like [Panicum miliaceum]|uniref:Aldo-keto reductase family 4 member C10-like n=1 Tax=Panicum miliaceum TaxID=4540 RepID=A0A3L6SY24_PANMI|nr:aldo-keto reductase family 4 member C10-like [Panicum miliaceum]
MAASVLLNTGASIPPVGLGTWRAEPGLVGAAVCAAVKVGYRHIDCAPSYGNEKEVGLALEKLFRDGVVKREDLFVTSKLWYSNNAPQYVPEAIQTTLDELQLEYLDLYLIHGPIRLEKGSAPTPENSLPCDIPATWAAMEKLREAGKARAIGVNNFSCRKLEALLAVARMPPAVNQVECHPGWQQARLRELCRSAGVHLSVEHRSQLTAHHGTLPTGICSVVLAYSPLGSTAAAGVNAPSVLGHPVVTSIAGRLQRTTARLALRWGLQMGQSVLPKSTDEARIKENLDIFGWSIPEELMAEFSEIEQACSLHCSFLCIFAHLMFLFVRSCSYCCFSLYLPRPSRVPHHIDLFPWCKSSRLSCSEQSSE